MGSKKVSGKSRIKNRIEHLLSKKKYYFSLEKNVTALGFIYSFY
jgi:hypothetical protein